MSEQVERRLVELLDHPTESPYGNPIPGLDQLGFAPAPAFMDGVVQVLTLLGAKPVTATVRRLGEPMQFDAELLADLRDAGVRPGAVAEFTLQGDFVSVQVVGSEAMIDLPVEIAAHLFVAN